MEHACENKESNRCFAAVEQHPILLTVHAGVLLLAGFYLLQSEPGDSVLQAVPTFGYLFKVWLTAALVLLEILLAGFFPGFILEIAAMIFWGIRMLSPVLALTYAGNHDFAVTAVLFVRLLALLLIGTLAGVSSLQITQDWVKIWGPQTDLDLENEEPDELFSAFSAIKNLGQLLLRRLLQIIFPLSVLIAGSTVWLM